MGLQTYQSPKCNLTVSSLTVSLLNGQIWPVNDISVKFLGFDAVLNSYKLALRGERGPEPHFCITLSTRTTDFSYLSVVSGIFDKPNLESWVRSRIWASPRLWKDSWTLPKFSNLFVLEPFPPLCWLEHVLACTSDLSDRSGRRSLCDLLAKTPSGPLIGFRSYAYC